MQQVTVINNVSSNVWESLAADASLILRATLATPDKNNDQHHGDDDDEDDDEEEEAK